MGPTHSTTAGMGEWRALAEYLLEQERQAAAGAAPADAARGLAAVIHVQPVADSEPMPA